MTEMGERIADLIVKQTRLLPRLTEATSQETKYSSGEKS